MDLREEKLVSGGFVRHPWEVARLAFTLGQLKRLLSSQDREMKILDVGCGDAFVVNSIASCFPNHSFYGIDIELSEKQLQQLEKENQENVQVVNSYKELEATVDGEIDLLLFMDILEHIEEPVAFVDEILKMPNVRKEVVLFITVPAFQHLFMSHDRFLGHYRRYTRSLLIRHCNSLELIVEKSGYFFSLLYPLRFLQSMLEKFQTQANDNSQLTWKGSKSMAEVVANVMKLGFWLESILRRASVHLPGLSVFALCRRSA